MKLGDILSTLYNFLLDRTKHIALRISVPLLVVIILFVVNDLTSFSKSYLLNRKIEQLIQLKKVDPSILKTDTAFSNRYFQIKKEILNDSSNIYQWWLQIKELKFNISKEVTNKSEDVDRKNSINKLWLNITQMALAYLMCLILLIIMISALFMGKNAKERWNVISACVFLFIVIMGMGYGFKSVLDYLIPIYQSIWINYLINIGIQVLFLIFIIYLIMKTRRVQKL